MVRFFKNWLLFLILSFSLVLICFCFRSLTFCFTFSNLPLLPIPHFRQTIQNSETRKVITDTVRYPSFLSLPALSLALPLVSIPVVFPSVCPTAAGQAQDFYTQRKVVKLGSDASFCLLALERRVGGPREREPGKKGSAQWK